MSRTLSAALGAIAIGALCFSPALAEGKQNFTLKNRTGYTIAEVYISPGKSDDWEEDVMGRDMLADGEDVDIQFERGVKNCHWDMKVVYDDSMPAQWSNFNLCEVSTIAIFYDRKQNKTWAEYE